MSGDPVLFFNDFYRLGLPKLSSDFLRLYYLEKFLEFDKDAIFLANELSFFGEYPGFYLSKYTYLYASSKVGRCFGSINKNY